MTTIPQKGAIVAVPSPKEAAEVYEVRALLEGAAAREFVEHASERRWRRCGGAWRRRASAAEHDAARDAPGEEPLLRRPLRRRRQRHDPKILEGLQARVAVLRATSLTAPGRPRQSVIEMCALVDAIERRDADAAAGGVVPRPPGGRDRVRAVERRRTEGRMTDGGVLEEGLRIRREVLGAEHVDRSLERGERVRAADAGARHRVLLGRGLVAAGPRAGACAA